MSTVEQEWRREVIDELRKIRTELSELNTTQKLAENELKHSLNKQQTLESEISVIKAELGPLQKHKSMMEGGIKIFGVIVVVVSAISGILKLFGGNGQ